MNHLIPLAELYPQHAALLRDAAAGDDVAARAVMDLIEEEGIDVVPFEVGKAYLIQTVTLYYVGRVVEASPCWLRLDRCSWVHRTGRVSTLHKRKSFVHAGWPTGELRPRTEYVGDKILSLGCVIGAEPWPVAALPEVTIQ